MVVSWESVIEDFGGVLVSTLRPFDFQEPNPVGAVPGLFDSLMASEPSEVVGHELLRTFGLG